MSHMVQLLARKFECNFLKQMEFMEVFLVLLKATEIKYLLSIIFLFCDIVLQTWHVIQHSMLIWEPSYFMKVIFTTYVSHFLNVT